MVTRCAGTDRHLQGTGPPHIRQVEVCIPGIGTKRLVLFGDCPAVPNCSLKCFRHGACTLVKCVDRSIGRAGNLNVRSLMEYERMYHLLSIVTDIGNVRSTNRINSRARTAWPCPGP